MKAVRRPDTPHEHEFEAARGLPEPLPAGERLLWQGAPQVGELARRAFHLRKLALYFALLIASRIAVVLADGGAAAQALHDAVLLGGLAAAALAIVYALAWLSARSTVYTITDQRVVMRIGIVLSVTFNLPLSRIATAGLHRYPAGTGDIPLQLEGSDRIAWLHLWPHVRPWRVARTEPMLRCVPDVAQVSDLLAKAWSDARRIPLPLPLPETPPQAAARSPGREMPAGIMAGAAGG